MNKKIKVIFLDIDGVLNSQESMHQKYEEGNKRHNDIPDKYHIQWLNKIIDATGAKVVISSSWRRICSTGIIDMLLWSQGFKGFCIAKTPSLREGERGDEIRRWLDIEAGIVEDSDHQIWSREPYDVESFVVLDDDGDMTAVMDNFVHCPNETGLCKAQAEKAIKILGRIEDE